MTPERAADVAEGWLQRVRWQPALFAPEPRRLELLRLRPGWECAPFRLRVHRNQPFEHVAAVLAPFLAFAGRRAELSLGDYDDSLGFAAAGSGDVELVWLDFGRYREQLDPAGLVAWLADRVRALRATTDAPILVANAPPLDAAASDLNARLAVLADIPGVRVAALSTPWAELGARARDARAARLAGTSLSDAACLAAAQALGLVWLPAALGQRVKAVVLDLDHTLYAGVLGEDGPGGVTISPAHLELHRRLLALRERGVFLALASRNEPDDVDRLFRERPDLLLRPDHFSARAVAFRDKAAGLYDIAAALRVAPEALLLVDDNPGEIASVAAAVPGVRLLHAADPGLAARALDLYPGLHGHASGRDDALRVADLAATEERERAARSAPSRDAYLRSLEIVLTFSTDDPAQLRRMAELSNKTNQLNTALRRFSEAQVAARLSDPSCRTVTVALRDRLSDSGTIAALFARRDGAALIVDELVVSCRALGRGVEHAILTEGVRRVLRDLPAFEVRLPFRPGPRNAPALAFLAEWAGRALGAEDVSVPWDPARAERSLASAPVTIVHEDRA
jgi:FkbH-like protein